MDGSAESPPVKKRCIMTNEGIMRPLKCRREFQLPQQFPSTMKQALKSGINVVESAPSTLMLPNTVKVLSSPEKRVPYNLQKLRILSPRGRDLGEFNVELRSADPLKGSTITITKSTLKSSDKSVTLPLSPVSHMRVLPRIFKQDTTKIPKDNLLERISCNRRISDTDNTNVSHQQQSVPISRILSNRQNTKGKMEKEACDNSINVDKTPSTTTGVNSKRSMSQTNNNSIKYTTHSNETDNTDIRNFIKIQEITAEKNKALAKETPLYKKIIELPCPANSKKFTIDSSSINNVPLSEKNIKVSKGKCIATIKNTENGKIVTSLKSAANLVQRNKQIDRNLNQIDLLNSSRKKFDNSEVLYDRNNSSQIKSDVIPKGQVPEIKTQNVMTIIPNNKAVSFNQNAVSTQECNTPVTSGNIKNMSTIDHSVVRHNDTKCDSTQSKDSKTESQNDRLTVTDEHARRMMFPELQIPNVTDANLQSKTQSKNCLKDLPQKDLSDRLNIIKKAMDSVTDNELRELALKALADCGIGIERYVPIRPPKDHKAVHDTQVQTVVFGLLDPKYFLLINKDFEDIHRLNQITLHDTPDQNPSPVDNSHSNNITSKDPNVIEPESPFDLDHFIEQFLKEDSDALKMKEALSVTRVRYNKLLDNLQKDFECVKQYDQNGMLNIHNAVISDNISLVQRQLIVLERCKQNIDILTEDGVVSLILLSNLEVNSV